MSQTIDKFFEEADRQASTWPESEIELRRKTLLLLISANASELMKRKEYGAAARYAADAARFRPELYEMYFWHGRASQLEAQYFNGDETAALVASVKAYDAYIASHTRYAGTPNAGDGKDLFSAHVGKAEGLYELGAYAAAVNACDATANLQPDEELFPRLYWTRGRGYLETLRPELALIDLEKVAAANPKEPKVVDKLAEALWRSGRSDEARQRYAAADALSAKPGKSLAKVTPADIWAEIPLATAAKLDHQRIVEAVKRAIPDAVVHDGKAPEPVQNKRGLQSWFRGEQSAPKKREFDGAAFVVDGLNVIVAFVAEPLRLGRKSSAVTDAAWLPNAWEHCKNVPAYLLVQTHERDAPKPLANTAAVTKVSSAIAAELRSAFIVWPLAETLMPPSALEAALQAV